MSLNELEQAARAVVESDIVSDHWRAEEDEDGYWSVVATGDGIRTPVHEHITTGAWEEAHRFIAMCDPQTVLALLAVVRAALELVERWPTREALGELEAALDAAREASVLP